MKNYNIYLAGGMGKFGKDNFNLGNEWRMHCKEELEKYECDYNVKAVNPNDFFNFIEYPSRYRSQREVMEFDISIVRKSDLIIANFNDKASLGTMAELAIAYENRIPIIGLNIGKQKLHPWQIEFCNRIFSDMTDMLGYVKDFYLNF